MPQKKHEWDSLVDDVLSYISGETDWFINAIKNGQNSPFEQPATEEQKKEYYKAQMYNDNGEPNEQGRQQVLQRIGILNYIPLLQELEKERSGGLKEEPPMPVNPEYSEKPKEAEERTNEYA